MKIAPLPPKKKKKKKKKEKRSTNGSVLPKQTLQLSASVEEEPGEEVHLRQERGEAQISVDSKSCPKLLTGVKRAPLNS